MIRQETQLEKIERLSEAIESSMGLREDEKKLLVHQLILLRDRISEFHIGCETHELKLFKRGFIYAVCRMLNISTISLLNDLSLWLDGDRLVSELELETIGEEV